ncbi:MAG: Cell division protein FtsA [Patescibacteria group bacterium]|nr:Cell division protein FtsA [Patescibacteria group bacterium]
MRESSPSHFIGLDIGTSTVRCVIGMLEDGGKLAVIGQGSSPNIGMRKGAIVHIDDVIESVAQAVTEAERLSGVQVHRATVNINGSHVNGMNSKGVIAISAANREITHDDRLRVEEAATIVKLPPNREIIQVFAKNYRLDGQDNIKDPVGMRGVRLEVDTHIVTAATPNMRSLDIVLDKAHVQAAHHTVSSLAAAEAVLNRQQKEAGTVLLDIGAGTTNLAVIEDGEVQHVAVIPIGGIHITNDLAIGLKTELDVAEAVKVQFATLGKHKKSVAKVTVNEVEHHFDNEEVHMITEARVEELLEYVEKELKKIQRSQKLPGGVVITGGTAKLPGLAEFTKEKLQLPARLGTLQSISGLVERVEDPSYYTAVGLMILDMLLMPLGDGRQAPDNSSAAVMGFLDGIMRRIKKH